MNAFRPTLEILEDRFAPTGLIPPRIDLVYLGTPGGSIDPQVATIAHAVAGGQLVSSIASPVNFGYSQQGIDLALKYCLFTGAIPYNGTNTTIVVVVPAGAGDANGSAYHKVLDMLGGQIPEAVVPINVSDDGLKFDLSSIRDGYFASDPPPPYVYDKNGILTFPPGPDSSNQLKAPNFLLGDLIFLALAQQFAGNQAA